MSKIGQQIKEELNKKQMTIASLAKKTNFPQATIDNVIYGRSKKREVITKIAKILGIPAEYFLEEESSNNFNAKLFHLAFNITYETMRTHKVEITKNLLDEYSYDTYLFALKEKVSSENDLHAYSKGLVFAGIKQGILKPKA